MTNVSRLNFYLLAMAIALTAPCAVLAGGPEPRSYEKLPTGTASPHLFAEGQISTPDDEGGGVFSPDGKEFYFCKTNPTTTFPRISLILVSHWDNTKWSTPEVLPFSGNYLDFPPRLSPDGKTMLFTSSRPVEGTKAWALRLWRSERTEDSWSEPKAMPAPINLPDGRFTISGSMTREGTLYFASDRGEPGRLQIYRSRLVDSVYQEPEKLGSEINSAFNDYDPYVNAEETLLFFVSAGQDGPPYGHRPEILYTGGYMYARGDIYVSQMVNGKWSAAQHVGHGVNSVADESSPALTPDGKHLIFSSERSPFVIPMQHRITMAEFEQMAHSTLNGHGNVYTIPLNALHLEDQK